MDPICRLSLKVGFAVATGAVSLSPYPSKMTAPVFSSNCLHTSGGSGAPPEKAAHQGRQIELIQQGVVGKGHEYRGYGGHQGGPVLLHQFEHLGKRRVAGPRVRDADQAAGREAQADSMAQVIPKLWYQGSTPR